MLELTFCLTSDDFVAFNVHFALTSQAGLRQFRAFRRTMTLVPSILMCTGIAIATSNPVAGVASGLVTFVVLWFLCPRLWRRAVRKNIRRLGKNNGLGEPGPRRLFADDRGLRQESANGESFQSWSGILRIEETPEHAFIYIGPVQAFVVPKRIGQSEVSTFLAEVRQHPPAPGQA